MEFLSNFCSPLPASKLRNAITESLVVIATLASLLHGTSCSISLHDRGGYISIDCGGAGVKDARTGLDWVTDEEFLDLAENIGFPVNVTLSDIESRPASRDNAKQLETAMVFIPGPRSPSKYCYQLNVSRQFESVNRYTYSDNYLVRVMFPSRNLSGLPVGHERYNTRFYYSVDSTFISTVDLDANNPQTMELLLTSASTAWSFAKQNLYICLVPQDRLSMPAISSIEVRYLPRGVYPFDSEEMKYFGDPTVRISKIFLTVSRFNFGGNESLTSVRYPDDIYDRLWYGAPASMNSPSAITNYNQNRIQANTTNDFLDTDPYQVPAAVWTSSWAGDISFTVNITAALLTAIPTIAAYHYSFTLFDTASDEEGSSTLFEDFTSTEDGNGWSTIWMGYEVPRDRRLTLSETTYRLYLSSMTFNATGNSTRLPLLNAFDLYGELVVLISKTFPADDELLDEVTASIPGLDTAGDPCLPVSWNWVTCTVELPPRIIEINLTHRGLGPGRIPEAVGQLTGISVLDLSKNNFQGQLPTSLRDTPTIRILDISDNNISDDLSSLFLTPLEKMEILSLRNNHFNGSLASLVENLRNPISRIDVSANNITSLLPSSGAIELFTNLSTLDLSSNRISGTLSDQLVSLPSLKTLNLENNNLSGAVPDAIWSSSSQLQSVTLNNNGFTELNMTTWCETLGTNGSFDRYPQVSLLKNNISTVIFGKSKEAEDTCRLQAQQLEIELRISRGFILLGGNEWCRTSNKAVLLDQYLCRNDSLSPYSVDDGRATKRALIIGLVVCGFVTLLMACVVFLFLVRMWKRMRDLRQIQEELAKDDVRPPFYKYEDVKVATKEFSQQNQLGKGAFGAVYKGQLQDNSIVAVKQLFLTKQNIADFLREVVLITGIKHRHLIQLKGCCVRDKKRILIYEYAENGNLAQALWGRATTTYLTWEQRLKICVGIAKGLSYLHEELQPKIIHRDIKPQNILLDREWNAKIADFGLARPLDDTSTQRATSIGGTLGYFSPEYATQGLLTEKLDVFSYGILVLEIIAGRPCIDNSAPENEIYLRNLAFKLYEEGRLASIAEEAIVSSVPVEEIESVLKVALSCLQEDHEKRPSMSQVVYTLLGNGSDVALDIVSKLKVQLPSLRSLCELQTLGSVTEEQEEVLEENALLSSSSVSSVDPRGFV